MANVNRLTTERCGITVNYMPAKKKPGPKPKTPANKRDYKKEYRDFHGTPTQVANRVKRNKARSLSDLKKGDGREIDHKVPLSKGGSNSESNTRIVSKKTNRKKGAK